MEHEDIKIVLDVETTGLDYRREKIIEFAAVKLVNNVIVDKYETLINPKQEIRRSSMEIHGITEEMVADAPEISEVMPNILEFIKDYPIIGHNVVFDFNFISQACRELYGKGITNKKIDTLIMFKEVFPEEPSHGLEALLKRLNVQSGTRHRAMADTYDLALAYPVLKSLYEKKYEWQVTQLKNIDYLFERYLRIQQAVQTMQAELQDIKSIFKIYFDQGGADIESSTGELLTCNTKTGYQYNQENIKNIIDELGNHEKAYKLNTGFIDRLIDSDNLDDSFRVRLNETRTNMSESRIVTIVKPERNDRNNHSSHNAPVANAPNS